MSNIWMCFKAGKALTLLRVTDYCPIPVWFLVCIHTNELNRAEPSYRHWHSIANDFQLYARSLAQFLLGTAGIDPNNPLLEDLAGCLETAATLVVGTLSERLKETVTGGKKGPWQ